MFAEFVRSGDLSPEDVVYDAETHEWSSALTHPVVLQIELDREAEEEEARQTEQAEEVVEEVVEETPAPAAPAVLNIGLELAPAPDQLTPAQASEAFVKKMKAERASDHAFTDEPAMQGFRMEQGSSGMVEDMIEAPKPKEPAPPPRRQEPRREEPAPPPRRQEPRREEPTRTEPRRDAPSRQGAKDRASRAKSPGAGRRYAPLVIVGAVVVAAGAYFGPELLSTASEPAQVVRDSVVAPPTPPPLIADTEVVLRARAQERFLTTTRALLRDLPPIPAQWMQGAYLAAPSDFPEVPQIWSQYLATIRQVREGDNERYRAGYLRALEDARVEGSARTLRLAGAVAAFQGAVAPRAAHYDRAEALANAALRAHEALVRAEGTIAFDAASGPSGSGDPTGGAVGRSAEAQSLLNQVLEMVSTSLDPPRGPGRTANVAERVWDGILSAVAN
jgi:hypothetical protein